MFNGMCTAKWGNEPGGCPGYNDDPQAGDLWPGETEEEFGYPIGPCGTREAPESSATQEREGR
jgi:hypothetical protein